MFNIDSGVMEGKGRSREAGQEAFMVVQVRSNGGLNKRMVEARKVWIGIYFANKDNRIL